MSPASRLLTERWCTVGDAIAFEGAFGDAKKVAMSAADAGRTITALSGLLRAKGVGSNVRVGVLSNHRIETYLAVLSVVAAGGTFVPLNPKLPTDRLRAIVGLAQPVLILGDRSTLDVGADVAASVPFVDVASVRPAAGPSDIDAAPVDPGDTAYVMFTSGSTGTPKGVPISYGNLMTYVDGVTELLDIPADSRFSQFFDLSFDLSMHDIFVSTRCHGTLVAPTQIDMMMPGAYVARERIDAWFSVPLLGAQLGVAARREGSPGFRSMLFCGEALPMETVAACRAWLADGGRMWNLYGPTEATIAFTAADVTDSARTDGNASIGRPFGTNRTAMLRGDGSVVDTPALGEEGELLLGGPQVFAGYSTDAPSPFVDHDATRWYRSGDLVRIDDEGVYFRGRGDSQVKFRGYRIELGEIETLARRAFGLKTVAVVVAGEGGAARLVMFHLASEASEPVDLQILGSDLPGYMVPAEAISLEAMPTNQNGKIDRHVLASMANGGEGR